MDTRSSTVWYSRARVSEKKENKKVCTHYFGQCKCIWLTKMKDKTTGTAYNLQFLTEVMKTEYNKVIPPRFTA